MDSNSSNDGRNNGGNGMSDNVNLSAATARLKRRRNVRLIMVNDVYVMCSVEGAPHKRGGLAAASTMVKALRKEIAAQGGDSLFFVAGDFTGGSNLAVKTDGLICIDVLNEMNVDAVCLGNHEFDAAAKLPELIAKSRFGCWLGSNVYQVDPKMNKQENDCLSPADRQLLPGVKAWHVFELPVSGVRVGVLGVCTRSTPHLSHPGPDIAFGEYAPAVEQALADLAREKVNLVVALTHVSMAEDKEILNRFPAIDMVLGGHDHEPMVLTVNDSILFKAGQNAYHVGVVDVGLGDASRILSDATAPMQPLDLSWSMLSTAGVEEDVSCVRVVRNFEAQERLSNPKKAALLDETVAKLLAPLSTLTNSLRLRETSAGTLFADAMLDYYRDNGEEADFAVLNGGFMRGDRTYQTGTELTHAELLVELPFPRKSICMDILGKHLVEAVEQQLRALPMPSGAFPHFSKGVKVTLDVARPPLLRVVCFEVAGQPLQPDRRYKIVTTEFMASGGDGCTSFAFGLPQKAVKPQVISEIVLGYCLKHKELLPTTPGRCVEVGKHM